MAKKKKKVIKAGDYFDALSFADDKGNYAKDVSEVEDVWLDTGCLMTSLISGGGCAEGRQLMFWGGEQAGKTTMVYMTMLSALAKGHAVVAYDHEGAFDMRYFRAIAAFHYPELSIPDLRKKKKLRWYDWNEGDRTYEHMRRMLSHLDHKSSTKILFVIDSLSAMNDIVTVSKTDEGESGGGMMSEARMHSKGLRAVKALIAEKGCYWIVTNQIRTDPSVTHGNNETMSGGKAVLHYNDARFRVAKKTISDTDTDLKFLTERVKVSGSTMYEEESAFGGSDHYVYSSYNTSKNKGYNPHLACFVRICVSLNNGPGIGADPCADTWFYLAATGQGKKRRKDGAYAVRMTVGGTIEVDTKRGETLSKVVGGEIVEVVFDDWIAFKKAIHKVEDVVADYGDFSLVSQASDVDIRSLCFAQFADRTAFALFEAENRRKAQKSGGVKDGEKATIVGLVLGTHQISRRKQIHKTLGIEVRTEDGDVLTLSTVGSIPDDVAVRMMEEPDKWIGKEIRMSTGAGILNIEDKSLQLDEKQPLKLKKKKVKKS